MIETDIKNLIVPTSSAIPAIGSRLYIGSLPDLVTWPAVVMYSISRINEVHEANIFSERIQFSIHADYLSSATDIADDIKDKLKRYYGAPSTSYRIINSFFENMSYLYDDLNLKYVRILDMFVRYMKT